MSIQVTRNSLGREILVVDDTVGGVQLTPGKARHALISVEGTATTHDVRMTSDGTAPLAATVGILLAAGGVPFDWFMHPLGDYAKILTNLKFIRVGGTSGKLQVEYFD